MTSPIQLLEDLLTVNIYALLVFAKTHNTLIVDKELKEMDNTNQSLLPRNGVITLKELMEGNATFIAGPMMMPKVQESVKMMEILI